MAQEIEEEIVQSSLDEDLELVFRQSSSITFISGKRDDGKTDFGFLLLEMAKEEGLLDKIAGNVRLHRKSEVGYIPYYDRFQEWLKTKGKKGYLLDELGKHLNRMRFMTEKSKLIMDTCQLVRKFDAHLIGIAPSEEFINRLFLNTDILDCRMKKLSRKIAMVNNYVTKQTYILDSIPSTSVPFITKDIAIFELKDPTKKGNLQELPQCCRASLLYLRHRSLRKVGKLMDLSHEEIRKLIKKHLGHLDIKVSTVN